MKPQCWNDDAIARAQEIRKAYLADPQAAAPRIRAELAKYAFYHNIEIAPGIETPGIWWSRTYTDRFARLVALLDFKGKRVLDIGCRDGAQAFSMEAAGASEICGIDNDFSPALANFLVPFKDSRLQCREVNVYDLGKAGLGQYDVVSCCGVVYHLQFPIWGLRQMRDAVRPGGTLILETAVLQGLGDLPVLGYPTGETSPYEGTSPSFFNLAGLKNALELLDFDDFTVHDEFNEQPFEAERHFPEFSALNPSIKPLSINRVMLTCQRRAVSDDNFLRSYFEGTHRVHSTGNDRWDQ